MKKKRYEYKGKLYVIFQESKMKIDGVWVECIIYQTLYDNPDGEFWVRSAEEFFSLFNVVPNIECSVCGTSDNLTIETKGYWCSNCDSWVQND